MGSFDKEPIEKRQMKLFALVLPALTFAQDEEPGEKKFSATVQFAWNEISSSSSWTFDTFVKRIQNYGCHCFPSAGRMPGGSGAPVDAIDEACRNLARCHSCVASDHGFVGRISQEKYRYAINAGEIDCSSNSDQQKLEQCQCDKKFAEDLGASWSDSNWDIHNGKPLGTTKNWTTLPLVLAQPAEVDNCKTPAAVPTQTGGLTALLLLSAVKMVPSPQSVLVRKL